MSSHCGNKCLLITETDLDLGETVSVADLVTYLYDYVEMQFGESDHPALEVIGVFAAREPELVHGWPKLTRSDGHSQSITYQSVAPAGVLDAGRRIVHPLHQYSILSRAPVAAAAFKLVLPKARCLSATFCRNTM